MNPRDQFIKEFVLAGKNSGATKEQVEAKLATALVDFDRKYPIKNKDKFGSFIPNVAQTIGNIAGAPFGKPGRVLAGGITRAAGESVRQAIDPETSSIGDAAKIVMGLLSGKNINEQILSPKDQLMAEKKLSQEAAKSGLEDLVLQGAIGAGTTAAGEYVISPALNKVGQVVKPVTDKIGSTINKSVEWLRKKGLEQLATTFKDNVTAQNIIKSKGGPEKLAQEFIDNSIPPTKNGVVKELSKMNSQYEKKITSTLKTLKQTRNIDVDSVIDDLIKEGKKIYQAPGGAISPTAQKELADFTNYLESFRGQYTGPKSSINMINEFRKYLDRAFSGKNPSNIVDGEKLANDLLANQLRGQVQNKAPITKSFFKRYSLLKTAEQIYYKEPKAGLIETVGAMAGGIPGVLASRIVKSPGAYRAVSGAVAGKSGSSGINALESVIMPTQSKLSQVVGSVVKPRAVEPFINPSIRALQRMIDKEGQSKQIKTRLP